MNDIDDLELDGLLDLSYLSKEEQIDEYLERLARYRKVRRSYQEIRYQVESWWNALSKDIQQTLEPPPIIMFNIETKQ